MFPGGPRDAHAASAEGGGRRPSAGPRLLATGGRAEGRRRSPAGAAGRAAARLTLLVTLVTC